MATNNVFDFYYKIKAQEQKLKDFTINAPFTGALTQAGIDPGDLVRPNMKMGEFLRTDKFEVRSAVSVKDVESLKIGQQLNLRSSASENIYKATVSRIGKSVNAKTQAVSVFMSVSGENLREGMYLEGELELGGFKGATELPNDVLTRDQKVYIIKDSKVSLQAVEVLAYRRNTAIVKGLKEGDLVITDPVYKPILGTKAQSK